MSPGQLGAVNGHIRSSMDDVMITKSYQYKFKKHHNASLQPPSFLLLVIFLPLLPFVQH